MKVLLLIWCLIKLITCIIQDEIAPQQQSYFLRVLKNKFFKYPNIIKHDEVHITKCLAMCNLEKQKKCDSVNYNDALRTCVLHLNVDENSRNDDGLMIDEIGWTYYEKETEIKTDLVSWICKPSR